METNGLKILSSFKTIMDMNMKRILILLFFIVGQLVVAKENSVLELPKVDKNVELLSIVFRLAGNKEYNGAFFKKYTDGVDGHFNAYKEHELIKFARELHNKNGISYDAVASMAVVLDKNLNPLIDFSTALPEKRWNKEVATKFVGLLKQFYKDADCEAFFRESEPLYQEVSNQYSTVYKALDLNWFQSFFGSKADENFSILLSPGCGGHNYGPSYKLPNAKKEVFAIMGTWRVDEAGLPIYGKDEYLPLMVHEFSHSFVNHLLDSRMELFEVSGKEIYKAEEYEMSRQQAYGSWQTMLYEALVRASVINYFIDHGATELEVARMLVNEFNRGFIWMKELVDELKNYKKQRDVYPTLESYMPVLSDAYKTFAKNVIQMEAQRPKVESITEFANNEVNVSPQLKTITINFDRPLAGKGYTITYGNKGALAYPKLDTLYYTNANKSFVMEVQLKPDKEYQFVLTGKNFKSQQGVGLKIFEVNFKTAKMPNR